MSVASNGPLFHTDARGPYYHTDDGEVNDANASREPDVHTDAHGPHFHTDIRDEVDDANGPCLFQVSLSDESAPDIAILLRGGSVNMYKQH